MKQILMGLTLVALLASCDVNIDFVDKDKAKLDSTSISFGVYVNRGVSTKAGKTGELTTTTLQQADGGFGVFSYYGNGALYGESSKPDFMYNEKVTFDSQYNKWDYHPIKYWPNEFGAAASSEAADRLTFFAYAPYVEVTPVTGIVTGDATTGIIGLSRNIAAGDPKVMYSANLMPGAGVDLCWGVAASDFTSSVDGDKNHVDKGKPFIDVIKPKTGDRMTFEFNHALTQLNVQVDADIDVESHATSSLAAGTHIYVRSVTFNGFTLRGSLNLNSNTTNGPVWYDISGTGRLKRDPVTVYDGRTDGLEAMAADVNEVPADLNPMIIQNGTSEGVTNTTVNLFNSTEAGAPVLVIPTSGVPVKVTIVYDIETADPSLPGYLSDGTTRGISVENTITKTVQLTGGGNMTLEAGKKYVIGLHLGLTSVKFDATVADWDNASYANTDLPINTSSIGSVTLSSDAATVWRNESVSKPTVTAVTGSDGTDLTSLATITWSSSNTSVATVNETTGDITLTGTAGSTNIVATAAYEGSSQTATFSLNVNEVTAVSITTDPSDAKAAPGGTIALTATLTHTNNGTIDTWPTVAWVSGSTDYFTVSPASATASQSSGVTTATTTATAVAAGTSTITVTVGSDFTSSTVSNTKDLTCENAAPTVGYFRGYDISSGILMRTDDGSNVTYSLTDGSNPFELYTYYEDNSAINKYYFSWASLRDENELGADGNNINVNSDKLPAYSGGGRWTMPSHEDWAIILEGAPLLPIKVGNTTISTTDENMAWALVTVTDNTNSYYGVILLRDGSTIPSGLLDENYLGSEYGGFDDNELDMDQFNQLIEAGCLFVSCSGKYDSLFNEWRDMKDSYWDDIGYYWSGSYWANDENTAYFMQIDVDSYGAGANTHGSNSDYYPVRLVKKIN
jgi:hypothetical protein